jgi:hypothetical protein
MAVMIAPLEPFPKDSPPVGSVWRHYKGGWYTVLHVGRHSETLEPMVSYTIAGEDVWFRPLCMWHELVDGKPRFERVR